MFKLRYVCYGYTLKLIYDWLHVQYKRYVLYCMFKFKFKLLYGFFMSNIRAEQIWKSPSTFRRTHGSCGMSPAPLSIMPPAVLRYTHRKKRRKGSLKLSQICSLVKIRSTSWMLKIVWQMDSICLFSPWK